MAMEMYKTDVVIDLTFRMVQQVYVYAENAQKAKQGVDKVVQVIDSEKLKRNVVEGGKHTRTQVIKAQPSLVAPIRGVKRASMTKTQKQIINSMLRSKGAMLQFVPKNGWTNTATSTSFYSRKVDVRTIVALRQRGLIKPLVTNEAELKAQQAVGSFEVGEFAFILDMDEIKKRKVYHDFVNQTS